MRKFFYVKDDRVIQSEVQMVEVVEGQRVWPAAFDTDTDTRLFPVAWSSPPLSVSTDSLLKARSVAEGRGEVFTFDMFLAGVEIVSEDQFRAAESLEEERTAKAAAEIRNDADQRRAEVAKERFARFVRSGWSEADASDETGHPLDGPPVRSRG